MSFTIICDKCGNKEVVNSKKNFSFEGIDIDVTEHCDMTGCSVESIDIMCWKCQNEINI